MLIPLLVRLTDSEVEVAYGMIAEVSDSVENGGRVREKVSAGRLLIDQEPLLSDLHIEPVHRNV